MHIYQLIFTLLITIGLVANTVTVLFCFFQIKMCFPVKHELALANSQTVILNIDPEFHNVCSYSQSLFLLTHQGRRCV